MVKKEISSWLETNRQIRIKNVDYWRHPVYDLYAADMDGNVININRKVLRKGNKNNRGYLQLTVGGIKNKNRKTYYVHRFVYESIFGLIPEGFVIDHINSNKEDNTLINLQLVSQQENCKRGVNNRNNSYMKDGWNKRKSVKAINIKTKQTFYFNSMCSAEKQLGISAGIVSMCCRGKNHCKTGISKKDGQRFKFEFTTKIKISKC